MASFTPGPLRLLPHPLSVIGDVAVMLLQLPDGLVAHQFGNRQAVDAILERGRGEAVTQRVGKSPLLDLQSRPERDEPLADGMLGEALSPPSEDLPGGVLL